MILGLSYKQLAAVAGVAVAVNLIAGWMRKPTPAAK